MLEKLKDKIEDFNYTLDRKIDNSYRKHNIIPVHFFGTYKHQSPIMPFKHTSEFTNLLKAPLAMPFICLATATKEMVDTFSQLALTVVHIGTLEFRNAKDTLSKATEHLTSSVYIVLKGLFDALRAAILLVTRSISTFVLVPIVSVYSMVVDNSQSMYASQ